MSAMSDRNAHASKNAEVLPSPPCRQSRKMLSLGVARKQYQTTVSRNQVLQQSTLQFLFFLLLRLHRARLPSLRHVYLPPGHARSEAVLK